MDAKTAASPTEVISGPDPYAGRPGRQWWLIFALGVALMMATVDKTIMSLLFDPIKLDMGLTDTQMSLVYGLAFAISNVVFTLPAGYFADRISRRGMIAVGSVVWSIMTSACGLVTGFGQLLAARSGIGFAEAVIHPCAFSMLRGGLAPERRGRGYAIYAASQLVGSGLGFLLGAMLLQVLAGGGLEHLPIIGRLAPWRLVLLILGVVGLPFTLLMLTVREPARAIAQHAAHSTWGEAVRYMGKHWTVYLPILVYGCFHWMQTNAYATFIASIPARRWGVSSSEAGRAIGPIMMVMGPLGLVIAGFVIDRLSKRFGPRGTALVGGVLVFLTCIAATASPLMPTPTAYFIGVGCVFLVGAASLAITGNLMAAITPEGLMGKISSIQLSLFGIVGLGAGPVVVGWVSDNLLTGKSAIALSLSLCSGVFTFIAGVMMCVLLVTLRRQKAA